MPPITESRLKAGTLTLDTVEFGTQARNVNIEPTYDEQGDALEVLSGDTLTPDEVGSYALKITAIQDFEDPAGFVAYTWDHELEVVPFIWKPSATGPTYSGNVKIKAATTGGDVNTRLDTEVEWPLDAKPTIEYPAP